jgi:quercetin dioxygenase-like cupin family protein
MHATPNIQRKALLTAALEQAKSVERIEIQQIELGPGQTVGLHRHPCPVVGYVAAGVIDYQIEGEPAQRLQAGSAFYEPAEVPVARFDNASTTKPATFVAFYLLDSGQHELIQMLEHPKG